jgi:hypothetical protein
VLVLAASRDQARVVLDYASTRARYSSKRSPASPRARSGSSPA